MNIAQIESNISKLTKKKSQESFIYDFLLAYGLPKASITRLQKGNLNLSKRPDEISWKKKVLFRVEIKADLHVTVTEMANEVKHDQRFVIVTDYKMLLAIDTKTGDKLDTTIRDLPKTFDFFLPWAGMEKTQYQGENPADVKAAEKMAKLFDEIKRDNTSDSAESVHNLNVFLSRLLFCYFAEDTNIFQQGQFINAISSHTQQDGSDLGQYLEKLFIVLNTEESKRKKLPDYLSAFPYVNGGLFSQELRAPKFTRRSRQAVIDCGDMDWSAINPDIFGSMMQAVVTPENRGGLGMHYTSVPNIMKVIEPLFLNELYEEFEKAKGNQKKLNALLERLSKLKIFDPACGSGNFLIIAYKELRKLEMAIFKKGNTLPMSQISLSQFYGIEIDDFAHEIAQLSLWLAEHQMNIEFFKEFGKTKPTLPLKEIGNICLGNAIYLSWGEICPADKNPEVFILGNPPYLGFQERNAAQKKEMGFVFKELGNVKRLDYIGCWFKLAADYIRAKPSCKCAFVTTNSICQGEQVSLLWPYIGTCNLEISFAHQTFKWSNSAKNRAGVSCNIIGLRNTSNAPKYIYDGNHTRVVDNINYYLTPGSNVFMRQRKTSISSLPPMALGSSGIDGGHLILTPQEKDRFIDEYHESRHFIRPFLGGGDFINGIERYCLWIDDGEISDALKIPPIADRIEKCKAYRLNAGRDAKKAADVPHRFFYRKYQEGDAIIIPMTSSESREYLPVGYSKTGTILSNGIFAIYDTSPLVFGILSSRMHYVWLLTLSGKLESRIRYSVNLNYNTFPMPFISQQISKEITHSALNILAIREKYPDKTIARLYDSDEMPEELRMAHLKNDSSVERCYRSKPFTSDEERLEHLFRLYKQMFENDKNEGTLFETEKKTRKRKK